MEAAGGGHTASERGKESLKRASRQLLLLTASDGIHILDTDGKVVEANDIILPHAGLYP
ncbi:MAG: hypothetical protein HY028_01085 [Gammaproteobacteria bacterium]|nr:hypothetical protein [Gammaproteobacteria bacterium]